MELIQERTVKKIGGRIAKMKPRTSALHWHENLEIVRLIDQPRSFLIDGEMIHAQPGDILVIDEYTIHQFIGGDTEAKMHILHMRTDCYINQPVPLMPILTHIPYTELEKLPEVENYLTMLFDVVEKEEPVRENVRENPCLYVAMLAIYYVLMRHFPAPQGNKKGKQGRNEFYKITEYINQHYTEDITVNSLCDVMFMTRKKLTGIFSKFSGTNINNYINMLRIQKVNSLLDKGINVTEAAFLSGFQSVRTFSAVYRKLMGITPSEYVHGVKAGELEKVLPLGEEDVSDL